MSATVSYQSFTFTYGRPYCWRPRPCARSTS
jgi:hypothetical protein